MAMPCGSVCFGIIMVSRDQAYKCMRRGLQYISYSSIWAPLASSIIWTLCAIFRSYEFICHYDKNEMDMFALFCISIERVRLWFIDPNLVFMELLQ